MKKFAWAIIIAAIAASPAAAETKKKAKKKRATAESAMVAPSQSTNQNSLNFAKDALPIFLPSWSMPAYMGVTGRKD